MTIRVNNTPVGLGDRLYMPRSGAWGTIVQNLDSAAVLSVTKGQTTRNYTITEGGLLSGVGEQAVFWHQPISLALPKNELHKLQKIQTVVDTLRGVL